MTTTPTPTMPNASNPSPVKPSQPDAPMIGEPSATDAREAIAKRCCEVIQRGEDREEAAITELLEILAPVASFYARTTRDRDSAISAANVAIWRAATTVDLTRGTTLAYLCRTIRNVVRTVKDQEYQNKTFWLRDKHISLDSAPDADPHVTYGDVIPDPDPATDPSYAIDQAEQVATLISHLGLTQRETIVIKMRLAGHTYDAIQQKLGVDFRAVDNAIQRCRKKAIRKNIKPIREKREILPEKSNFLALSA